MTDAKNEKNTKKKKRKNSNYRPVYKYVNLDRLCRKTLCDYRNAPAPRPELGESEKVDANLYETGVRFCEIAGIITPEEKAEYFDGKNHVPMSAQEVSEFTGIPIYQVEKNLFAFKAQQPDDFVRASMIRLALCDIINGIIAGIEEERELHIDSEEMEQAAGYINFCSATGTITEEQGVSVYMKLKQKQELDFPFISSLTGISADVLQQMAEG